MKKYVVVLKSKAFGDCYIWSAHATREEAMREYKAMRLPSSMWQRFEVQVIERAQVRGVKAYALEMLERFEEWREWNEANGESVPELDQCTALNGAKDWRAWSYGGLGLVYNAYIAERLCTPSELRKLDGGARVPAGAATWCDIEARAAFQAWCMIVHEAVRVCEA